MHTIKLLSDSVSQTQAYASALGDLLRGGEVIEFISDVGGGKTTFIKGMADGLGIRETVQSPTFTISRIYNGRDNIELHHFDFYRLQEPGIMAAELAESIGQPNAVVAVEWGESVHDILSDARMTITIKNNTGSAGDDASADNREILITIPDTYEYLQEAWPTNAPQPGGGVS